MHKSKNKLITLLLLLAFIIGPHSSYQPEAAVITASGVILAAKIIGWTATGISASKTAAEAIYQQIVSAESMKLYKQRLGDLDSYLDKIDLQLKSVKATDTEALRKLMLKKQFILQEKVGLGTVVRAIEENRDAVVKKKIKEEVKSVVKGYVLGEVVPKAVSKGVEKTTGYVLSQTEEDMVGAVYSLYGTLSNMPADAKKAWLDQEPSAEDKEYYRALEEERGFTQMRRALLEAQFDKYINEVAKPLFKDYMNGKSQDYLKLPVEIRKLVTGEYEAKQAERAKERERQLEEYRKLRLENLKEQQEQLRNREEMTQTRLEIIEQNPQLTEQFKKVVDKKPLGDEEKLGKLIAGLALGAGRIALPGATPPQTPKEGKTPELTTEAKPELIPEPKKKDPDFENLCDLYRKKRKTQDLISTAYQNESYQCNLALSQCAKMSDEDARAACFSSVYARIRAASNRYASNLTNHNNQHSPIAKKIYSQRHKFLQSMALTTGTPLEEVEQYITKYSNQEKQSIERMQGLSEESCNLQVSLANCTMAQGDSENCRQILARMIQIDREINDLSIKVALTRMKLGFVRELKQKIEKLNQ